MRSRSATGFAATNELVIRCLPLAPALEVQRKPRARWRTNLVADGRLRWFRTMILGRAPGFAPGPPAVGPWRPVWLVRRRGLVVEALTLRPSLDGDAGLLRAEGRIRPLDGTKPDSIRLELDGPSGRHAVALELAPGGEGITFRGTLQVRVGRALVAAHARRPRAARRPPAGRDRAGVDRRRGRTRRVPDARRPGRARRTTSSATAWTCTSTASGPSPAARSGRRPTSSGSRRPRPTCDRPSKPCGTPG